MEAHPNQDKPSQPIKRIFQVQVPSGDSISSDAKGCYTQASCSPVQESQANLPPKPIALYAKTSGQRHSTGKSRISSSGDSRAPSFSGKGTSAHFQVHGGQKPLSLNVEQTMPGNSGKNDESLKPYSVTDSQWKPIQLKVADKYHRMREAEVGGQTQDQYWQAGYGYPYACGQWFSSFYNGYENGPAGPYEYQMSGYPYQDYAAGAMQNFDPYQACTVNLGEPMYNCGCFDASVGNKGEDVGQYPVNYDRQPSMPPLITWKKKQDDKYGTLLVQRGKSQMVVKIPVNEQIGHEFSGGSQFYNFAMLIILIMSALWAYVY